MSTIILRLYVRFQDLMNREEGQDLVEYALVIALMALGAVAGMKTLTTGINNEFGTVSSTLGSAL